MKLKNLLKNNVSGSILLPFIIVLPFLILIIGYYMDLSVASYRTARKDQFHTQAQLAADAGADYAMGQINSNEEWAGTSGEVTLHSDSDSKTTYSAVVTTNNADSKTITVTGRTYWPATSSTVSSTVKLNVGLRAVTSGEYSVVSGVGGLTLKNSAKILGGDVLVNGTVSLSNTAQIGLTNSPVTLKVAQQSCPVTGGATYPRLCNSGEAGQPITFANSAKIYGDVKANNQTSGANMYNPGLTTSSGVVPGALPTHDRNAQKAAISSTITSSSGSCSGSQTKTWNANTKITGNVTISNNCVVTVLGNIWITGTLSMSNSAQMIVSNTLGTTRPNIMVDGSGGASFSNSSILKSNSSNMGFQIISYYSTAGCSPDCNDVTGQDLYSSRNIDTVSLNNSASGPQTIFYARWTAVNIVNSGQIGALIGQTVKLANSGTITFGTSVSTGTKFWIINGYRRSF